MRAACLDLEIILIILSLNLLFPVRVGLLLIFTYKTGRVWNGFQLEDFIEGFLFILVVICLNDWTRYAVSNPLNDFSEDFFDKYENRMANMIWDVESRTYRFDFVLGIIALMIWIKLFFLFRFNENFGTLFKILKTML
jgi:hypothetical protein